MHGGKALRGAANPAFKHGRFSEYMPADVQRLYEEALSNPDLLEMSDHIALLEGRVKEVLQILKEEEVVPRWSILREIFQGFMTAVLTGDEDEKVAALEAINEMFDAGEKFDRTWATVQDTQEQLRKIADTEIKRRKELQLMVPIERVLVLMGAVATAVKRHVTNPAEIQAVYEELETFRTGSAVIDHPNIPRRSDSVSNLPSAVLGPGGGTSREAQRRTRKALEKAVEQAVDA